MKLRDIFDDLKGTYLDKIILMKSGNFYLTYDSDAMILSNIFGYKKANGKVGFPVSTLKKVTAGLKEKQISYMVYEEEEYDAENNEYYIYFKKASDGLIAEGMTSSLNKKIKEKIMENIDNYQKINYFIDEL